MCVCERETECVYVCVCVKERGSVCVCLSVCLSVGEYLSFKS